VAGTGAGSYLVAGFYTDGSERLFLLLYTLLATQLVGHFLSNSDSIALLNIHLQSQLIAIAIAGVCLTKLYIHYATGCNPQE
jgi:hypothetical protein